MVALERALQAADGNSTTANLGLVTHAIAKVVLPAVYQLMELMTQGVMAYKLVTLVSPCQVVSQYCMQQGM